jgi:hypothetical protein
MATVTPNFNWPVPTSTDLVKDGATAIEALGDAIDGAFVDLKGGTTGQVLAKASATDLDFSWVAQDDSNAIQNAIVDAKGDLISATAADTPARLAVGTDGHVLTVDSTTATGLKWAAVAGGGKVLQVVSATTSTKVTSSSNTFVTTGLNCSITPSSTSSRILVLFTIAGAAKMTGNTQTRIFMKLQRGTTDIQIIGDSMLYQNLNQSLYDGTIGSTYVDSPATTSSTNYRVVFSSPENVASVEVQGSNANTVSSMVLLEIGA